MSRAAAVPYLDRPRLLALSGVGLGSLAAWIALALLHEARTGPGHDWIGALCGAIAAEGGRALAGAVAIWALMSIAMMLPTAAPAVDLYVRLTRRIEARRAAHVAGFAGGYILAWAGFAMLAGGLQAAFGPRLVAAAGTVPAGVAPGAILVLAGLYQLTPLKQACLALCRNPLALFLGHWREGAAGALRMGLRHGLVCIGCCWALMGLMFLAGAMNLAWMATLGLAMLIEKAAPGAARAGRLAGVAMALAGAALIAAGLV